MPSSYALLGRAPVDREFPLHDLEKAYDCHPAGTFFLIVGALCGNSRRRIRAGNRAEVSKRRTSEWSRNPAKREHA